MYLLDLPLFKFLSADIIVMMIQYCYDVGMRVLRVFGDTYPDPSEVHGLSDQLVVLGDLFLRGKLHKAFADLSTQPGSRVIKKLFDRRVSVIDICGSPG